MTPTIYDARAVELGRRQQPEKNKDNPKFKQKGPVHRPSSVRLEILQLHTGLLRRMAASSRGDRNGRTLALWTCIAR